MVGVGLDPQSEKPCKGYVFEAIMPSVLVHAQRVRTSTGRFTHQPHATHATTLQAGLLKTLSEMRKQAQEAT